MSKDVVGLILKGEYRFPEGTITINTEIMLSSLLLSYDRIKNLVDPSVRERLGERLRECVEILLEDQLNHPI